MASRLKVLTATPSTFEAEDPADPRFYVFARLTSGILRFELVAKLDDGTRSRIPGREFFAAVMGHFGGAVQVIDGEWSIHWAGLTTNIDELNRLTAGGLTLEQAALRVWTGRQAKAFGYSNVEVVHALPVGAQGTYQDVLVRFRR